MTQRRLSAVFSGLVVILIVAQQCQGQLFGNLFGRLLNRSRGSSRCNHNGSLRSINGQNYLVTIGVEGCKKFTWNEARQFCASKRMRMISLDDSTKARALFDVLRSSGDPYFWTGGNVDRNSVTWQNGRSLPVQQLQKEGFFSPTGKNGVAQPDNREGNENCLAVLNNFYGDGVRYHDVACHHRKPTVCEF